MTPNNVDKLKQAKLNNLLTDLNNLSRKHFYYQYKEERHYLMFKIGLKPYTFRYFNNIDQVIFLVENLVKYRMVEYEEESYE